ncbi:MAG TPA: helix-turn-helix domain-containing protein [Acidimicrobiales bacterium]
MTTHVEHIDRPLRADAERNRAKILDAAAKVFAERGLDATLDEVAAAAGVGVGTVYRRFADKDALIGALFENGVDEIADLAGSAKEMENSWNALVWFLEEALQRQCSNRGLREVVAGSSYAAARLDHAKCRIMPAVSLLVERAQRDGYLRDDVVTADFAILEMMISLLGNKTSASAPELWRRYLRIILDGLVTARGAPSELHDGPDDSLLSDVLRSVHHHSRRQE